MPPKKKDPGKQSQSSTSSQTKQSQDSTSQTMGAAQLIGAQPQPLSQISPEQWQQLLQMLQPGSQTTGSSQEGSSKPSKAKQGKTRASRKEILESYAQGKLPQETWSQTVAKASQKELALELIPKNKQEYDQMNKAPSVLTINSPSQNILAVASSKAIVSKTQTPLNTPYFPKENHVRNLFQIEPEFLYPTPNQVALNAFPSGWHHKPHDLRKTRKYYEFILIHSESISIDRKMDKQDESLITHSTLQILKVLTPTQWGQDLHKSKSFGVEFEPSGYNYWDYVEAWSCVFWDQNKFFKHTWFIYFKSKTKYHFPQWFVHWWNFFGPVPEILPPQVQQALELFKQNFNKIGDPFPIDLHYFSKLSAAWIFSWQYRFSPTLQDSANLPILQRIPFVRWWASFELNRINTKAVERWFKANPQHLCDTEQSKFLNQKSRIQSTLAITSSKEDMIKQLSSLLHQLQGSQTSSDKIASSASSTKEDEEEEDEQEEDEFIVNLGDD